MFSDLFTKMTHRTFYMIAAGAGMFVLLIILAASGISPWGAAEPKPQQVTLQFWGTDDPDHWRTLISDFNKVYSHIRVNYRKIDPANYETVLLNALAEGTGPDIFYLHNGWIQKHKEKISPFPQNSFRFTRVEFEKTFADIALKTLVLDNEIIGFPLYVDTLALFYNKDMFNAAGIPLPPGTWEEIVEGAGKTLTRRTAAGDIVQSGIAIGASRNVRNAAEILTAIILQNGDAILTHGSHNAQLTPRSTDALAFYATFSDPLRQNYFWSSRLPNSLDAFAEGRAAMMIGFQEDIALVRAKNPHLAYAISPFPQPKDATISVTYGKFYFPTVSRLSPNKNDAWIFLYYAAVSDSTKTYLQASGRAPARRDLIAQGTHSSELDTFYRQSLTARTWAIPDYEAALALFTEAIDSVVVRTAREDEAIQRLRQRILLLVR